MKYSTMFAPMFSSQKFQDHGDKSMTAELSELLDGGFGYPFGRIYSDAIDVGFEVRHVSSMKISTWYLSEENTSEGDITHWVFYPTPESLARYPKLEGYKITIFND